MKLHLSYMTSFAMWDYTAFLPPDTSEFHPDRLI